MFSFLWSLVLLTANGVHLGVKFIGDQTLLSAAPECYINAEPLGTR